MPFPQNHLKLTFGGTIADGEDIWSCGLSIAEHGGDTPWQTLFNAVSESRVAFITLVEQFVQNQATLVPNNVKVLWVKLAPIGVDGKYLGPAGDFQANSGGAVNAPYIPQASIVNSLVSSKWKDPGRYNRFYLPYATSGAANSWKLTTAQTDAYAQALVTFIDGINDAISDAPIEGIAQVSAMSNTREGSALPVVQVRVGNIVDTQRRRRNSLTEVYSTATVGVPPS